MNRSKLTNMKKITAYPTQVITALCLTQALVWTLAPALTHSSPPLDVVELLVWGREGVIATHKHPNLPGLVLDSLLAVSFGAFWPIYLTSQLFVIASFVAVYALGRSILGTGKAVAGTLLLAGIFYYSWPTPEMNHNLAQLPLWAGICLALWKATRGEPGYLTWWIALGCLAALAMWAKYSSGVLLAVALGWLLHSARTRVWLGTPAPWLALAIFSLLTAPQVIFLLETTISPIDYALMRATQRQVQGAGGFMLAQLAAHSVFFLMAIVAGIFDPKAPRAPEQAQGRRFLVVMGLGPALLTVVLSFATGLGLKDMWGMPMFNLSGLVLLSLIPGRVDGQTLWRLTIMAGVLLIVVPSVYAASVAFRSTYSDKPSRAVWPQEHIAGALTKAYTSKTGNRPRIIAGPIWEAGLVALAGTASVLIDGDAKKSPWITLDELSRFGALAVWTSSGPPSELQKLLDGAPSYRKWFRWSDSPTARPITVNWAVIPVLDSDKPQ